MRGGGGEVISLESFSNFSYPKCLEASDLALIITEIYHSSLSVSLCNSIHASTLSDYLSEKTCAPLLPPSNGKLKGSTNHPSVVCDPGYSPDPRMKFPYMLHCREGQFKLYSSESREWITFAKAPDCVGKLYVLNASK